MRTLIGLSCLLLAGAVQAQSAQCGSMAAPKSLPIRPTVVAPIAPELVVPSHQLGAPTGVLSQAFDESLSVDQVLFRLRVEGCQVAKALPAAPAAMPNANDPAAYKPKTQFDNTPWRFDMNQNGKRMTAEEFDAWMKAKGVRVVKAKTVATPPPAVEAPKSEPVKK
ncbi:MULTISPECIES: hypothetical protein [unclassified Lysobacter]|uniref:hypothetical protein n=1 Tax=unclassified Lysobacter TaxID=2635362 RepID=UPI001C22F8F1|nr:hypothetical protein [Lysobacter sp. MMG2]MBU8975292.1 hypothetical protein [Lysobacter sp. MMG2]